MITARPLNAVATFGFGVAGGLLAGAATFLIPFAVTLPLMLAGGYRVRAAFLRALPARPDLASQYVDLLIGLAIGATIGLSWARSMTP